MSTIKISELATSAISLTDFFAKADANGIANKNTVQGLSNFLALNGTLSFKGVLLAADAAVTEDGIYVAGDAGTYTNNGGLVITVSNQIVLISITVTQTVFEQAIFPITLTIDATVIDGSVNAIQGNAVFDALALKSDVKNTPILIGSKNLFNIDNKIDDYYVKYQDGTLVPNTSFIVVTANNLIANTDYAYTNQGVINPSGVSTLQQMAFFDINGNFVSGNIGGSNLITFNTGANIVTAKFTIAVSRIDYEYQLELGTTRGYYEPYSKTIENTSLNPSLQKTLRDYTKEVKTFSTNDYSKNYTNLRTALESCTDVNKEYEIWLYSSVSNVLTDYFTEAEINDVLFKGLDIPDNVTLVNPNLETEIVLRGFLDTGIYGQTTVDRVSTLNFIYNGGLKGVKVTGENLRYAVHDDISSDKVDSVRLVEDCVFEKIGTNGFTQAYGAGTRSGMIMTIKRSKFSTDDIGASFSCHNNTGFTKLSKIVLENNVFDSVQGSYSVAFGSINSTFDDEIVMIGNQLNNGIQLKEEGSGVGNGIDFKLRGYGNTKVPVFIENTDTAQYTYIFNEDVEELRNRAGSTISKGTLVYLNSTGSGGVFPMSPSFPNQYYGIAFEDIPTLQLGKIKPFVSGQWVALSDTNLVGASVGTKIAVNSSGVLIIWTSGDYIGVVLLNDFIRLK